LSPSGRNKTQLFLRRHSANYDLLFDIKDHFNIAAAECTEANRLLNSNSLLPILRQALTRCGIPHADLLELARSDTDWRACYLWAGDHHLSARRHLSAATKLVGSRWLISRPLNPDSAKSAESNIT